jgi:hypothetical protein
MGLAQARKIDAILVTELSRWGRSTPDLVQTLDDLHGRGVSVLALNGLSFDLSTSNGKLMRTIMAGIAERRRGPISPAPGSGRVRTLRPTERSSGASQDSAHPTRRPSGCSTCTRRACRTA